MFGLPGSVTALEKYSGGSPSLGRPGVGNITVSGMYGSAHSDRSQDVPQIGGECWSDVAFDGIAVSKVEVEGVLQPVRPSHPYHSGSGTSWTRMRSRLGGTDEQRKVWWSLVGVRLS